VTSSAPVRGTVPVAHTPASIIRQLQRYHALYGMCTAACFSPSAAKLAGRQDLVDRYYAGDPEHGPWASLNTIKSRFNDSFTEALEAAGLPANTRGPDRRKPGELVPIRESHVGATRIVYVEKRNTTALAAASARAERAEAARDRAQVALAEAKATPKVRTVTNTAALQAARARAKEAREAATRAAGKLERAEATINTLRADRREDRAEIARLQRLVAAAENQVTEVRVEVPVERVVTRIVERSAPGEAVIAAAHAETRAAVARERAAVACADEAHAAYMELASAVNASRRRLTTGELADLRARGPAGPAVLAAALKRLARARRDGGRGPLDAALVELATAAMSWRDRL
jgi:hypothetical protein